MDLKEQKKIKKKIEDGSIYQEYRYKRWRKRVFKRDGYQCQFPGCKWPKGSLNAHHIYMKWYNPEFIFELANGISLCKHHHTYIHKKHSDKYIKKLEKIAKDNAKKPKISKKILRKRPKGRGQRKVIKLRKTFLRINNGR